MSNLRSPTRSGYDRLSIVFHWATLFLLVTAFASIEGRVLFERGTEIRTMTKELHYVLGLLILLTTLARLTHRLGSGGRPTITPMPATVMMMAAHVMAALLYAALLITPVLGLLSVQMLGDKVNLGFGLSLPAFIGADPEGGEIIEHLHSFFGDTLYVLIGGHAVAALAHHFLLRDSTLANMAPMLAPTVADGSSGTRIKAMR